MALAEITTRRFVSSPAESARPVEVLMVGKSPSGEACGGGEIQMVATAEALGPLGPRTRLGVGKRDELDGMDCVHLFGSRPDYLPLIAEARRRGIPVLLSPIAWFDLASYWRGGRGTARKCAACARFLARAALPRLPSWRRRLYHAVDRLLPNSRAEMAQLVRYFQVPKERLRVVPNGADERFADARADRFIARFGLRDFVLCPGRIEPRKNQLTLIQALHGTELPLVVLGAPVPGHEDYFKTCRGAAGPRVHFLGRLDHDDPLLAGAYAACGCVALASWFETPGLVALEAGMTGAPLVLPSGGAAREYFGDRAVYVHPGDLAGIRRAVRIAMAQGRSPDLADYVRKRFSWNVAAAATWRIYQEILD